MFTKPHPSPVQWPKAPLWKNIALAKGCPDSHLDAFHGSLGVSQAPRPLSFCSSHTTSLPANTINNAAGNEALTH